MPIPTPRSDEDRAEFVSRCMGTTVMVDDYPDAPQRAAVCYDIWRRRDKHEEHAMQKSFVPTEWKADGESGQFKGYASIFENVDLGGDVIRKGAFKEIMTNANGQVKVLYSHDSGGLFGSSGSGGLPIGLANVEQNTKGLKFNGQLVMSDPFVQRVHAHMKAGSLDGMSIGYDILPGGANTLENGTRELIGLKLWEISPVVWGMNPKAHISDVKAVRSVRELEDLLRDAAGLSRKQAALHASAIWKTLAQRDSEVEVSEDLQQLVEGYRSLRF